MGGLDVPVAVIDTDDDGISVVVVVHKIHSVSFLPHSGDTKTMMVLSESSQIGNFQLCGEISSCQIGNWPLTANQSFKMIH